MQNDQAARNKSTGHEAMPGLLRRMNERRILETIQNQGSLSRAALVRRTGISPPTVSKLVRSLIAARLLEEGEMLDSAAGRPARSLRLADTGVQVLGAVVDIKECAIAATGLDGRLRDEQTLRFPTPDSYEQLLTELNQQARRLTSRRAKRATLALGLSVPGLIDRREQKVTLSSNLHLLEGHYLAADLQKRLRTPTFLMHENDAMCLGERAFGQARGMDNFAFVDATFGLGAAIMSGGRLVHGHNGLAGEIGHITVDPAGLRCGCGNTGCLETIANDSALAARISERIGRPLKIDQVIELARSGELDAEAEVRRAIEYLAIAIAAVVNIFNPAAVFLQSRMLDIRKGLFETLLELVGRRALGPSLTACKILRGSSSKLQSAVAGTIHHLTTVLGPKI